MRKKLEKQDLKEKSEEEDDGEANDKGIKEREVREVSDKEGGSKNRLQKKIEREISCVEKLRETIWRGK